MSHKVGLSAGLCAGFSGFKRLWVALALLAAGSAEAHTGHGTMGFVAGLVHPFGLDHLLAMVAVGAWSAQQLPGNKVWQGPATFMAFLLVGAIAGVQGMAFAQGELMVALSVVLLGGMLAAAARVPAQMGLVLIAMAAALHGMAHGAEAPDHGFATYAVGFLITTAALHFCGTGAGWLLRRQLPHQALLVSRMAGMAFAGAGVYLASQV